MDIKNNQSTVSIEIPKIDVVSIASEYATKVMALATQYGKIATQTLNNLSRDLVAKLNQFKQTRRTTTPMGDLGFQKPSDKNKNYIKIGLAGLVLVLVVVSFLIGRTTAKGISSTYADSRPSAPTVKAQQILNKDFSFPLTNDKGEKVSTIKYRLTTIDMEDSIIVNGQRANAVKGRTFLILNLEITNNHTQGIEINSRDYVRLSANGKDQWTAADIHNDPVQVQAISTKITRLGFPVSDTDKNLKLQIGEIKGKKEIINLELK